MTNVIVRNFKTNKNGIQVSYITIPKMKVEILKKVLELGIKEEIVNDIELLQRVISDLNEVKLNSKTINFTLKPEEARELQLLLSEVQEEMYSRFINDLNLKLFKIVNDYLVNMMELDDHNEAILF